MKRVVADTNILVSAVQFGGKPKHLLDLAADGQVDLAISEAIVAETLRVLRDKFHRTPEWLAEAEQQLRVVARFVEPPESLHVIEADPSDDRILECAVAAVAEVIVSGDSHILALGSFRGIPLLRVAELLSRVQSRGEPGGAEASGQRAGKEPDERD